MEKLFITFHECEHYGDLENYMNDLIESGAFITGNNLNYNEETADVRFSVENKQEFLIKFSKTSAFEFSNYESLIIKPSVFDTMKKVDEQSQMDNIPKEDYGINPSY